MLNIYIGYDSREDMTYKIAEFSILSRTKLKVNIIPIVRDQLPFLTRPVEWRINEMGIRQLWCPISDAPMSTEFAISRFAVPFMQDGGKAIFMDSDMVCLSDIKELFDLFDKKYAVQVVKHVHVPTEKYHDSGQMQTFYKRKNWSSLILWNMDHPANQRLTLEELNTRPGRDLHAFHWLTDFEIGELPESWNYLVGVNEPKNLREQKMIHYTNGQPGWGESWVPQDTDYIFNEEVESYENVLLNMVL